MHDIFLIMLMVFQDPCSSTSGECGNEKSAPSMSDRFVEVCFVVYRDHSDSEPPPPNKGLPRGGGESKNFMGYCSLYA